MSTQPVSQTRWDTLYTYHCHVRPYLQQLSSYLLSGIPTYQGPLPPPNRFKVMPGYRWDGVDRSTGFEQRFHERINRQKVTDSSAYAWSTEDM